MITSPTSAQLADLIEAVRFMIGAQESRLTDDQIIFNLSRNSALFNLIPLQVLAQNINGTTEYKQFTLYYDYMGWSFASNSILQYSNTTITPSTSDWVNGTWTTDTDYSSMSITGYAYDLMGTAADCLENVLFVLVDSFDFSVDKKSFNRSQSAVALERRYNSYDARRKQGLPPGVAGGTGSKVSISPSDVIA